MIIKENQLVDPTRLHELNNERDVQLQALWILAGQAWPLPEYLLTRPHHESIRILLSTRQN